MVTVNWASCKLQLHLNVLQTIEVCCRRNSFWLSAAEKWAAT